MYRDVQKVLLVRFVSYSSKLHSSHTDMHTIKAGLRLYLLLVGSSSLT